MSSTKVDLSEVCLRPTPKTKQQVLPKVCELFPFSLFQVFQNHHFISITYMNPLYESTTAMVGNSVKHHFLPQVP